ncbi:MAG: hypothetical protein EOP10_03590 [Proteobacteria bacterium]|nr:MAG: hypothetical protein EOP10_03590 [Pseudomonadota bacterium]
MFDYLNQYYPFLIFGISSLAFFSRRLDELRKIPTILYLVLTLASLQPWIVINYFRQLDLGIFSIWGLLALNLMIARSAEADDESWLKALVSGIFGMLFLQVSLHPSFGLPFSLSTEWAQCLSAAAAISAMFLLYGLPPVQQGFLDLGSIRNTRLHIQINVLFRFVLSFFFIAMIQGTYWMENLTEFYSVISVFLLLAVAVSRLVLRLQTNPYRMLSYLSSGFALTIVFKLNFIDKGAIALMVMALAMLPFLKLLNPIPPKEEQSDDLWNVTNFYRYHGRDASHFFKWLKVFLGLEAAALLMLAGFCIQSGSYGVAAAAIIGLLAALGVITDKQAFQPRATV